MSENAAAGHAMLVKDIMKEDVSIAEPAESVQRVSSRLAMIGAHHMPVVDDGIILGIVSAHDIDVVHRGGKVVHNLSSLITVGDLMSAPVVTVTPDTKFTQAIDLMIEKEVHCLPVLDDDEKVVGIVTQVDVFELCRSMLEGDY